MIWSVSTDTPNMKYRSEANILFEKIKFKFILVRNWKWKFTDAFEFECWIPVQFRKFPTFPTADSWFQTVLNAGLVENNNTMKASLLKKCTFCVQDYPGDGTEHIVTVFCSPFSVLKKNETRNGFDNILDQGVKIQCSVLPIMIFVALNKRC